MLNGKQYVKVKHTLSLSDGDDCITRLPYTRWWFGGSFYAPTFCWGPQNISFVKTFGKSQSSSSVTKKWPPCIISFPFCLYLMRRYFLSCWLIYCCSIYQKSFTVSDVHEIILVKIIWLSPLTCFFDCLNDAIYYICTYSYTYHMDKEIGYIIITKCRKRC